jgi:hypothetical protein
MFDPSIKLPFWNIECEERGFFHMVTSHQSEVYCITTTTTTSLSFNSAAATTTTIYIYYSISLVGNRVYVTVYFGG